MASSRHNGKNASSPSAAASSAGAAQDESYGTGRPVTKAGFLASKGPQTEAFVQFSAVLGSRGPAGTVRDTRGFAVKSCTAEGNFDLAGNNMPVFFILDGIKFPTSSTWPSRTRTGTETVDRDTADRPFGRIRRPRRRRRHHPVRPDILTTL